MLLQSIEKLYYLGKKDREFTGEDGKLVKFSQIGFTDESDEVVQLNCRDPKFCEGITKFQEVQIICELVDGKRTRIIDIMPWEDLKVDSK